MEQEPFEDARPMGAACIVGDVVRHPRVGVDRWHGGVVIPDCPLCGNATFWHHRRPGSPWICGVCVPPRHKPYEVEWAEEVLP